MNMLNLVQTNIYMVKEVPQMDKIWPVKVHGGKKSKKNSET